MIERVEVYGEEALVTEPRDLAFEQADSEVFEVGVVIVAVKGVVAGQVLRDRGGKSGDALPGEVTVYGEEARDDGTGDAILDTVITVAAELIEVEAELRDDEVGAGIDFLSKVAEFVVVAWSPNVGAVGREPVFTVTFGVAGNGNADLIRESASQSGDEFSCVRESFGVFEPRALRGLVSAKGHDVSYRRIAKESRDDVKEFGLRAMRARDVHHRVDARPPLNGIGQFEARKAGRIARPPGDVDEVGGELRHAVDLFVKVPPQGSVFGRIVLERETLTV